MPQFTLNFEVDPPAAVSQIVDLAAKHGWSIRIESSRGVRYRLPPNVLVGAFESISKAEDSKVALFAAAGRALGITIKVRKFLLAEYGKVQFDSDDRKSALKADSPSKAPVAATVRSQPRR